MGGHLATFETLQEIIWVKGYRVHNKELHAGPVHGTMWIGGREINNKWYWEKESYDDLIEVTDCTPGEPDNDGANGVPEDCIGLFGQDPAIDFSKWFHWNDAPCELLTGYNCEKNYNRNIKDFH